jgi:hypothetical protein
MALHEDGATDIRECKTARGTVRVWTLLPTVYVTCMSGHLQDAHAELLEAYGQDRIERAGGQLYVFHDWIEMSGYDATSRQRMTTWSVARRHVYAEVHLAIRSKIVAMGAHVANIALGGLMHVHGGRAALELELGRVLRVASRGE